MPQQPNTGDAGSPRRPRTMDKPRRAAWAAAFERLDAEREVPTALHEDLTAPWPVRGPGRGRRPGRGDLRAGLLAARIRLVAHPSAGAHHRGRVAPASSRNSAHSTPRRRCGTTSSPARMTPTIGRCWITSRRGISNSAGCFPIRWPRGRSSFTWEIRRSRPRRSLEVTMGAPPMRRRIGTWRWPRCFTCSDTWACTDRTCAVA